MEMAPGDGTDEERDRETEVSFSLLRGRDREVQGKRLVVTSRARVVLGREVEGKKKRTFMIVQELLPPLLRPTSHRSSKSAMFRVPYHSFVVPNISKSIQTPKLKRVDSCSPPMKASGNTTSWDPSLSLASLTSFSSFWRVEGRE